MGKVFWMTGLSGAGKTSLANGAAFRLKTLGHDSLILDGDVMRSGLCSDLGFSNEDRAENNRRCAEVAKLIAIKTELICLCAFISPLEALRQSVLKIIGKDKLKIVFVDCSLDTCIARDPKGNYRKVREGIIKEYTGLGAPFEPPLNPDLWLKTDQETLDQSVETLVTFVLQNLK